MTENVTIGDLTAVSALTGTEYVEVEQGGASKRTTTQDIADLGGGSGATVLHDFTFTSDLTEKEFTFSPGVTAIEVFMVLTNASASTNSVSFAINGDTTSTNYYTQYFGASNGTTVTAAEQASNAILSLANGGGALAVGTLMCGPSRPFFNWVKNEYDAATNVSALHFHHHYTGTNPSSFTSLTITGNQSSGIGTGSRIIIREV